MKKSAKCILLSAALCLAASGSAEAANRDAQRVAGLTKEHFALLAKYPALLPIDGVIRSDCAAKNKGRVATDAFCGCAAALTMSLWRSGVDPNMMPRLIEYLGKPTDAGAATFLRYQGSELYRPLCTAAAKQ